MLGSVFKTQSHSQIELFHLSLMDTDLQNALCEQNITLRLWTLISMKALEGSAAIKFIYKRVNQVNTYQSNWTILDIK